MKPTRDYVLGLVNLVYVLGKSDDEFCGDELSFLQGICKSDGIGSQEFGLLMLQLASATERECYNVGIHHISMCSRDEQLKAFVWMYRMAHADGKVSPKEVRLLLYSARRVDITIEEVIKESEKMQLV